MDDHGISSSVQNDVTTVKFNENDALYPEHEDTTVQTLNHLVQNNDTSSFVFDLGNIILFPSSAIGMFVTLHNKITDAGRTMTIRNLTPDVLESLQFLHLDKVFVIEDADSST